MNAKKKTIPHSPPVLALVEKAPSGIEGLDTVTGGGLPRGRPTLVCGGAGSGKTMVGMQFLVAGALQGEPGVAISFEENEQDLILNAASLGLDLKTLIDQKLLAIDYVKLDRSEILETGGYDLSGLFVRLEHAIDSIGAKRVVLDTLEVLFSSFANRAVLRSELERLFRWLKDKGVTAVATAEHGDGKGGLTRDGLEEYVSDCVISLDQRVTEQVTTRRLRVVKYRGSAHGANEYPFLIDSDGVSVLPITGIGLDYAVSSDRLPTGIAQLDGMFEGKGYFKGSSVLVSGTAGTGKSSVVASYVAAACERGERCLYLALEEPAGQVVRNMKSIGLELAKWAESGTLEIVATRPTTLGLEQHLVSIHAAIRAFRPDAVVVDPVSSLISAGNHYEVKGMLVRLFDYLKMNGITSLFTYLSKPRSPEDTEIGLSSIMDTWIELRDLEEDGERNRALYILKSRGMSHSNQVRPFLIRSNGIDLAKERVQ